MQKPTTITIITSPTTVSQPLPSSSPTTKQGPVQYRIEERHRTVYFSSDQHPSQWDPQSITQILKLADIAEGSESAAAEQSLPRTNSTGDPFIVIEESPTTGRSKDLPPPPDPSRISTYFYPRRSSPKTPKFPSSALDQPRRSPKSSLTRPRILFYHKHDPHYGFTNFSAHPVYYRGKKYPTSEHLFQSFKFQDYRPGLAEHIRTCSERPSVAFAEARRFSPEVRPDWKDLNLQKMEETLYLKFTQHLDLKAELLSTGNAELIEDSDKDAFWGVGPDGKGRNELGKALERLRDQLREA
ncbi:DUF1768-domain-containing protein [Pluteus cervinus]|uniref:DUF1768-domain-containing protein n=1 Tax=Pluteus cervinus TaxID=181527 RepID=A0ACD3AX91_9AGAR|nr:DUF1768-domain-containing protein [Pluteus cervinus]